VAEFKGKGKEADLYSAFIEVPYTQGAQYPWRIHQGRRMDWLCDMTHQSAFSSLFVYQF